MGLLEFKNGALPCTAFAETGIVIRNPALLFASVGTDRPVRRVRVHEKPASVEGRIYDAASGSTVTIFSAALLMLAKSCLIHFSHLVPFSTGEITFDQNWTVRHKAFASDFVSEIVMFLLLMIHHTLLAEIVSLDPCITKVRRKNYGLLKCAGFDYMTPGGTGLSTGWSRLLFVQNGRRQMSRGCGSKMFSRARYWG